MPPLALYLLSLYRLYIFTTLNSLSRRFYRLTTLTVPTPTISEPNLPSSLLTTGYSYLLETTIASDFEAVLKDSSKR